MISMGLPLYDSLEKLAVEERYLAYMVAVSPSGEAVRLLRQLRPVRRGEIAILPGAGGSEDFPRMSGGGSLPGGFL